MQGKKPPEYGRLSGVFNTVSSFFDRKDVCRSLLVQLLISKAPRQTSQRPVSSLRTCIRSIERRSVLSTAGIPSVCGKSPHGRNCRQTPKLTPRDAGGKKIEAPKLLFYAVGYTIECVPSMYRSGVSGFLLPKVRSQQTTLFEYF